MIFRLIDKKISFFQIQFFYIFTKLLLTIDIKFKKQIKQKIIAYFKYLLLYYYLISKY